MAITPITYTEFNDGDSGLSVRTKLNALGTSLATLSTEIPNEIPTLDIGYADYNDTATATTPISVPSTSTYVDLINDGLGAFTNKALPTGVTDVWDTSLNAFDWSELSVGDMIDIRLDCVVTTTSPSQNVIIVLELGSASPYDILFIESSFKAAGAHAVSRFNGIYIGSEDTRTGGGKFKIKSDGSATVKVNGWYVKVIKK